MRCLNCEFCNQPDAPFCLDCGEIDFTNSSLFGEEKEDQSQLLSSKFVYTSIAAITLIALFVLLRKDLENLRYDLFFVFSFGLLISFLILFITMNAKDFFARRDKRRREMAALNAVTLSSIEDEINYRLHLLTQENGELINLFAPVYEDEDAENEIEYVETNESEKLLFETVEAMIALRRMQLDEVELIRLEGEVMYYQENLNDFIEKKVAEDEQTIENLLQELDYLQEYCELDENNGYIDLFVPNEKKFIKKVESARKLCEIVREELIEKRETKQHGIIFSPPRTEESSSAQEFSDFQIKHILDDYEQTFNELERECKILKAKTADHNSV